MTARGESSGAIPFAVGQSLLDEADPSRRGQFTGKSHRAGPHMMLELRYPDGTTKFRPLRVLSAVEALGSIDEQLAAGRFGKVRDLQRLITFEKLKGTLHEVIYSMEAAQVDFYPYQFKPVIKFIDSPTERLVIADEVGLGKTIESLLIWMELVARRQARRLLIVCPKLLTKKWQSELRTKFTIDSQIVGHAEIAATLSDLRERGPGHGCVLITSYSALRPPKAELAALDQASGADSEVSAKTRLLQDLRQWELEFQPFDLVVFDEAHYMRNPGTASFRLGESLASGAEAVLCVSATPVNNRNADLHTLLRLVDPDFFQTQGTFEALLEANHPTVQAANALAKIPPDAEAATTYIEQMRQSRYIADSPLLAELEALTRQIGAGDRRALARAQALVEKLNLLGAYVTRTRRVQVKERRPLREPQALLVRYSPQERILYDAILHLVRQKCRADSRPMHMFHVMGLQLRAASCLPAIAGEIRAGRLGDATELLSEALGEVLVDFEESVEADAQLKASELPALLDYDFESNDSKYQELRRLLLQQLPDDKVVLFSFYHATLRYLVRRLSEDGIPVALIHGKMSNDERLEEIERVKESAGRMVLLSSEVGSEGLDLQFCRVVVNYDLPWNPMRVEQRIGRIDRIGQEAKKLVVVNFKVTDTIEERLFDRLHSKLSLFANSLGDLEEVIGHEVQRLTVQLLGQQLTPDEERRLVDQTSQVIEQRLLQIQALEESGDALLSLSDYLQRKLEEDRDRGRFIQPEELEDYVRDFFEREFQGCELAFDSPAPGCFTLRLTTEAFQSLSQFVGDDQTLLAQPFRRRDVSLSFRRDVVMQLPPALRRRVVFANHMSPLVRWITKINSSRPTGFHPVAAIELQTSVLPEGSYSFRVERWRLTGMAAREQLAYGVRPLGSDREVEEAISERAIQELLRSGETWDYPDASNAAVRESNSKLEGDLAMRFDAAVTSFDNDNATAGQIRSERVKAVFERRIAFDEQRLRTLRAAARSSNIIRAAEGKLQSTRDALEARQAALRAGRHLDVEREPVAAGILRITKVGASS